MINLRDNLYLYEVKEYKLGTRDKKLYTIKILKDISGKGPSKYIAKPTTDFGDVSKPKKEYIGKGESENQALQDCIDKIADIDIETIFDFPKK